MAICISSHGILKSIVPKELGFTFKCNSEYSYIYMVNIKMMVLWLESFLKLCILWLFKVSRSGGPYPLFSTNKSMFSYCIKKKKYKCTEFFSMVVIRRLNYTIQSVYPLQLETKPRRCLQNGCLSITKEVEYLIIGSERWSSQLNDDSSIVLLIYSPSVEILVLL